jgi:membrane protease YdiL (CAAX protease family)
MASVYPTGFCANITALIKGPRGFARIGSLSGSLVGFVIGYPILVVVVALVRPHQVLAFEWPTSVSLLVLAPVAGIACIALEYLVGVLILYVRTHRLVTRVTVHSSYAAYPRIDGKDIVSVLVVVVGEELILRQFLFRLLATDMAIAVSLVILLCAVAYAINHLALGATSALAKFPSGLVYVWLFYVSGLSIAVVVVAHATQNLTLLGLSRRSSWLSNASPGLSTPRSWWASRRSREVGNRRWR